MKSFIAKPHEVERKWFVVDAEGKTLGRLASEVASILRGKHKPIYTPHVDTGDYVIIVNAEKIHVTGKKVQQKMYRHHTGFPGGLKEFTFEKMLERKPEDILKRAVKGMLPKGPLGRDLFRNLRVYKDENYKQVSQNPEKVEIF